MNLLALFDINNTLVHIPLGAGGYAMSWIEAVAAVFGLLCIWYASKEKTINYLFGLINVTLFAIIFYQSSYMRCCSFRCFSSGPISMAGMRGRTRHQAEKHSVCVGWRKTNSVQLRW